MEESREQPSAIPLCVYSAVRADSAPLYAVAEAESANLRAARTNRVPSATYTRPSAPLPAAVVPPTPAHLCARLEPVDAEPRKDVGISFVPPRASERASREYTLRTYTMLPPV